jgi:sugar (pentulose or hexulose) kinase
MVLIFDIGKTNKKCCVFDEDYRMVYEQSAPLPESKDEDGFPCEDLDLLHQWLREAFLAAIKTVEQPILAVNFSGYGASFVLISEKGVPVAPLYNYLKPFPAPLHQQFYAQYGGEEAVSRQTASPILGNLNSGMQLYRLKYEKPKVFARIHSALHLPQYLSFCFTGLAVSDISSIGCHTQLWNFDAQQYADWVAAEGILEKLAPITAPDTVSPLQSKVLAADYPQGIQVGIGLHDSSAALIPYLDYFSEPFVLLSTGTWCISMNPFNDAPLTPRELQKDCLCYLSYQGKPIKSSRLLAGKKHELAVKQLAKKYAKPLDYYRRLAYDPQIVTQLQQSILEIKDYETAYHALVLRIVKAQYRSTKLVLGNTGIKRIFVDGGFAMNPIYMHLLAQAFPAIEVYAADVPQASAIGAALAIHEHWNKKAKPVDLISLHRY